VIEQEDDVRRCKALLRTTLGAVLSGERIILRLPTLTTFESNPRIDFAAERTTTARVPCPSPMIGGAT